MVLALHKGEVDCISAGQNEADLWMLVWSKVGERFDEDFTMLRYGKRHMPRLRRTPK